MLTMTMSVSIGSLAMEAITSATACGAVWVRDRKDTRRSARNAEV